MVCTVAGRFTHAFADGNVKAGGLPDLGRGYAGCEVA